MNKNNFLLKIMTLMAIFLTTTSCTVSHISTLHKKPPTKSFVKVISTLEIKSCVDGFRQECPIGSYSHSGSGMAIRLFSNATTIMTAGHVCDMQPNEKVKSFNQIVKVVDYTGKMYSAWPINITHYNQVDPEKTHGDLCLLYVPDLDKIPKVSFSRIEPKVGEELFYIGAPLGVFNPPTVPIFKGIYSGQINNAASMATFPAIGGASGAVVLNRQNEAVGVVFAANVHFHHITLITNHKSFLKFLEETKMNFSDIQ